MASALRYATIRFIEEYEMKRKPVISVILVCSLLADSTVWASTKAPVILSSVLGSGGGQVSIGSVTLDGTIGQSVVGVVTQSGKEVCSGFWCDLPATLQKLWLPLVRK